MKYIFLEKIVNNNDPSLNKYFYFITDNKETNYLNLLDTEKTLIHFKDGSTHEISFDHNSPKDYEPIFGEIYLYILHNNLSNQPLLKFTIDDNNNIEKAE